MEKILQYIVVLVHITKQIFQHSHACAPAAYFVISAKKMNLPNLHKYSYFNSCRSHEIAFTVIQTCLVIVIYYLLLLLTFTDLNNGIK